MRTIPVFALMLLVACGRDLPGSGEAQSLRQLLVEPSEVESYVGGRIDFSVQIQREDGSIASVLGANELTLESTNEDVFTINSAGAGVANAVGQATIEARYQELAATVPIRILEGTPVKMRLEPEEKALAKGETLRLRALLTLSNNEELDVTRASFGTSYESEAASRP
jgi:hypothetical protein